MVVQRVDMPDTSFLLNEVDANYTRHTNYPLAPNTNSDDITDLNVAGENL